MSERRDSPIRSKIQIELEAHHLRDERLQDAVQTIFAIVAELDAEQDGATCAECGANVQPTTPSHCPSCAAVEAYAERAQTARDLRDLREQLERDATAAQASIAAGVPEAAAAQIAAICERIAEPFPAEHHADA